jgi:hypothetical protein
VIKKVKTHGSKLQLPLIWESVYMGNTRIKWAVLHVIKD